MMAGLAISSTDDAEVPGFVLTLGAGVTLVGFAGVLLAAWNLAWIELAWSLACFSVGLLIGLLFSVAKIVENTSAAVDPKSPRWSYAPNSSLEQISDWLTKILVGLSLVEIAKIRAGARELAMLVAASLGGSPAAIGIGYATIVFFPVMGFLSMYFAMRLYLNSKLSAADKGSTFSSAVAAALDNPQTSLKDPNRGVSDSTKDVAADTASVPLDRLSDPDDVLAWARAQAIRGNWSDAVKGYAKALPLSSSDPKLRLDYAVAMYSGGASIVDVIEQLKAGLERVDPTRDPDLASRLQQNLALAYLYLPPPDGFEKAFQICDQLLYSGLPTRAVVWYYKACASGQRYTWEKARGAAANVLQDIKKDVLDSTRRALDLDPSLVKMFQMVSDPTYRDKSKVDNDLEPFIDDPEFRTLVWNDRKPPASPVLDQPLG